MNCFEACTPPATAYGILLKNQKELNLRIKLLESLIEVCEGPESGINVEPLYEFGTLTLLGNLVKPLGSP